MLFDHHVHSKYSVLDSSSEISDIIGAAKERELGGIAVTDHDAIGGSLKAAKLSSGELLIVPGMEVSSLEGHIVGLGIRRLVERDLSAEETVERIHKQGGLAVAAHPYDTFRSGVGDLCWKLDFDAIEVNGHCVYGNGKAKKAAEEHGKPLVGGSDAHTPDDIGTFATEVGGGSAEELLGNIKRGECRVVQRRSSAMWKASVLKGRVSRGLKRKLSKP